MTIYLSPSDLAFLYDQSPWGFYQKYRNGIKRPHVVMPKIFTVIDSQMKSELMNQNLHTICKDLPNATLTNADKWVVSKEISNPEYPDISIQVRGKIDAVFDYNDGSYSVVDFKTSEINESLLQKYKRQLNAYCFAVLFPENLTKFNLPKLKSTGLLVFEPNEFSIDYNSKARLRGDFKWVEYSVEVEEFENYVKNEIIPLLAGKEPKPTDDDPQWEYLKQFGFEYVED